MADVMIQDDATVIEDEPTGFRNASIGLRALFVLRRHHPEKLCPASLMIEVDATMAEVARELRGMRDLVIEEPFPAELLRQDRVEVDSFFFLNPSRSAEIDRVLEYLHGS